MPFIDQEVDLPFTSLEKCTIDNLVENPKSDLRKSDKEGLQASIEEFGIRDRLKVWPHPKKTGKYIILNGNRRIDLIKEHLEIEFGWREADDDDRPHIESQIMSYMIPCQILANLTEEQAKLFIASWDRNRAVTKDELVANIFNELKFKKESYQKLLRPPKALVSIEKTLASEIEPESPEISPILGPSASLDPSTEDPWGEAPVTPEALSNEESALGFKRDENFVPVVFSLTREGYEEVTRRVLKTKSRLYRQKKLIDALDKLDEFVGRDSIPDDDVTIELALRILGMHENKIRYVSQTAKPRFMASQMEDDGEDAEEEDPAQGESDEE